MILDRYLIREVAAPFLAVTSILIAIIVSYNMSRYLADAAQGQIPAQAVAALVALRMLIALEVLLPAGLYLGLLFGLGRLHNDQEMVALQAGGLRRARMLLPLLCFTVLVALLVALLSWFGRPWAYTQLYALETAAEADLDLSRLQAGRFQSGGDGRFTLYAERIERAQAVLHDVFVTSLDDDRRLVIRAERMTQPESAGPDRHFRFVDGRLYRLDNRGSRDQTLVFKTLDWRLLPSPRLVGYKRKAASTAALLRATDADDVAERQWRLSRPAATVFLALLAIALARASPRRGRFAHLFAAVVIFALYYNVAGVARTWVENASVAPLPGLYWVDALIAVLALTLLLRPGLRY